MRWRDHSLPPPNVGSQPVSTGVVVKGGASSLSRLVSSARYEALRGAGYQCAVPGAAFDALLPSLGPTVECFASPLNARYERFCSAFGDDLEAQFGSLGSFFDFDPREGSFEANPPLVPTTRPSPRARRPLRRDGGFGPRRRRTDGPVSAATPTNSLLAGRAGSRRLSDTADSCPS